ncbi:LOW QUALITY PROTEIN: hypothetical protein QYF61_012659 [Mycteria americana]|uniref:Uncharacterized protein n=1 Tax=Mycteria americana TaxID=33587 RepID=A0AAN7MYS0_MYCAM|nr:LOW QUALITY PROTEIN: hypothetical protein QYF61_012659 [Mycteria americana]
MAIQPIPDPSNSQFIKAISLQFRGKNVGGIVLKVLQKSRDGNSTTSLGSLFQCLITLSVKYNFLISSLNLPWHNLRPFPLVLSLVTWEKRPTPPLYNLLSVVESNKVSPQPPFLQAKPPQFPQPLLIRLLLQTLHQL